MRRSRCLVLFTKPARPGRVKTRLMPSLTARQAADLHQAFLDDLVPRLRRGRFDLRIAWALEGRERPPGTPVPSFRQRGGDLGDRLFTGLTHVASTHALVAAVGSDHPELRVNLVERAFEELEKGARIVLGPAADGGYYLAAFDREALDSSLFEGIPWSTDRVLRETVDRCRSLGIEPALLPPGHDVDSPDDLERLARQIARGGESCPNVEALLRRWGTVG